MYEINVIGTLQVTKALLPALEATGARHRRQRRVDCRAHGIRGVAVTRRPSMRSPSLTGPCDSSCGTDRSGSPRSRLAWCRPRASHSCDSAGTRSGPTKVYEGVKGTARRRRHRRRHRVDGDPPGARQCRPARHQAACAGGATQESTGSAERSRRQGWRRQTRSTRHHRPDCQNLCRRRRFDPCSRLRRPPQNSTSSGTIRKPPQKSGTGTSSGAPTVGPLRGAYRS